MSIQTIADRFSSMSNSQLNLEQRHVYDVVSVVDFLLDFSSLSKTKSIVRMCTVNKFTRIFHFIEHNTIDRQFSNLSSSYVNIQSHQSRSFNAVQKEKEKERLVLDNEPDNRHIIVACFACIHCSYARSMPMKKIRSCIEEKTLDVRYDNCRMYSRICP
jgi:hypothetical protein